MPGRKPKPTELLKTQGTFRKDRHDDQAKSEPKYPALIEAADPPPNLIPEAVELWRWLVPQLVKAGVATDIDIFALAMLCNEGAYYWKCVDSLKGGVSSRTKGGIKVKAAVRARESFFSNWYKLAGDFGLTPAARRNIIANKPTETDITEDLF